MTTQPLEQGFLHFSKEEILAGCDYAQSECKCTVNPNTLKLIANEVGGARARDLETPLRDAIEDAILNYESRERVFLPILFRRAYIRSVGHMFGERNPVTAAKRERDKVKEVSYGLEGTSDIDPKINEEIASGLTGHPLE